MAGIFKIQGIPPDPRTRAEVIKSPIITNSVHFQEIVSVKNMYVYRTNLI